MLFRSCADAALEKDRHYTWRVRVWDEADTPSAWSAPSDFSILTSEAAFAGSEWIGAITRKDARIPEGRKYHGSELKKPEAKAAWAAVDTLAKKSIYLRREFHVAKYICPKIKTDFMNRIMVNTYWWRFLQLNKS